MHELFHGEDKSIIKALQFSCIAPGFRQLYAGNVGSCFLPIRIFFTEKSLKQNAGSDTRYTMNNYKKKNNYFRSGNELDVSELNPGWKR